MNKGQGLAATSEKIDFEVSFLGEDYNFAYVTGHGMIQLTKVPKNIGDYFNFYKTMAGEAELYNSHATIAPYYGDFWLQLGGQISWRIMGTTEIRGIQRYGYKKEKSCEIDKALVATWDKVLFTTYETSHKNGYLNSFQVIIATCTNGGVRVSFNYGDIEQDGYQYTGSDKCGENGNHFPLIGFAGKNGFWEHVFSNTDQADLVDDTSNVGVNGRWNIKFDEHGQLATDLEANVTLDPIQSVSIPKITISTGAKGTSQFLSHAALDQTIDTHGCHCAGILGGEKYGGPTTVDDVDSLCKQWKSAKNCLYKKHGACHGDEGSTYEINEGFDKCEDVEGCGGASCAIDVFFMQKINDKIMANLWTATEGSNDICAPAKAESVADSCCGEAPFVKAYDSNSAVCIDGQL